MSIAVYVHLYDLNYHYHYQILFEFILRKISVSREKKSLKTEILKYCFLDLKYYVLTVISCPAICLIREMTGNNTPNALVFFYYNIVYIRSRRLVDTFIKTLFSNSYIFNKQLNKYKSVSPNGLELYPSNFLKQCVCL